MNILEFGFMLNYYNRPRAKNLVHLKISLMLLKEDLLNLDYKSTSKVQKLRYNVVTSF